MTREEHLEQEMFKIIRRRDDDNDYGYKEMVHDVEALFGLTAVRNIIRLEQRKAEHKGEQLSGALRVIAEAVGEKI